MDHWRTRTGLQVGVRRRTCIEGQWTNSGAPGLAGPNARFGETGTMSGRSGREATGSYSVGGGKGQFEVSVPPSISKTFPVTQLDAGETK